jgi:hypothetical protein
MSRAHKDGTLGESFGCEEFFSLETCPICIRAGLVWALNEARFFAGRLAVVVECPEAESVGASIRAVREKADSLTWKRREKKPAVKKGVIL